MDEPLPPVEHYLRADRGAPRRFHRDRLHLDPLPPLDPPCDPGNQRLTSVAVGAGVTSRPPRRSRRAAFPHRAPVEGQTRPVFGAWAPVPVRGLGPSGTCRVRLCVRGMRWPLPFLRPFPPRSPPPTRRPVLFEASSVLCGLLRPSGPASAPRLPEPTRDRQGGCGRSEVSQVPTRSLTARTGLRWSDGPSHDGPAHVACGGSQRLGLHGKNLSKLNTVLVVSLCTLRDHRHR